MGADVLSTLEGEYMLRKAMLCACLSAWEASSCHFTPALELWR